MSIAMGASITYGAATVALGTGVRAYAQGEVVLGTWNKGKKRDGVTTPNGNILSPDDPVFEVGTGTAQSGHEASALIIFRDGTVRLSKASGGISMGQFN